MKTEKAYAQKSRETNFGGAGDKRIWGPLFGSESFAKQKGWTTKKAKMHCRFKSISACSNNDFLSKVTVEYYNCPKQETTTVECKPKGDVNYKIFYF